MKRDLLLERLQRYFADRRDVVAAYLFGSCARDEAGPRSDVDVGVILTAGRPRQAAQYAPVIAMQGDLEQLCGREVDLVPMNGAAPDLLHRILRDGVLLHEGDHARRVEFELRARQDYLDLLPMLEYYRRKVLGSV